MAVSSPYLDSIKCPVNATTGNSNTTSNSTGLNLRIGATMTCNGTYTIKPWDLNRGMLYFSANATSSSLTPWDQVSGGPPVMMFLQPNTQLDLDVLASTCHQVTGKKRERLPGCQACRNMRMHL